MKYQFDPGEIVQYSHPDYGQGKGVVVGATDDGNLYVVYPKQKLKSDKYPYHCFLCSPSQLISTPF